jgi:hypothetical protein
MGEKTTLNLSIGNEFNFVAASKNRVGSFVSALSCIPFCGIQRRKMPALTFFLILSLVLLILAPITMVTAQKPQYAYDDSETAVTQTVTPTADQVLIEIDCSLTPTSNGSLHGNLPEFGSAFPNGNFTLSQFGNGNFNSGQFGDFGSFPTIGQDFNGTMFGGFGGSFMRVGVSFMDESSYSDVSFVSGVVAVAPILQVSENQNLTATANLQNQTNNFNGYLVIGVPLSSAIIDVCPVLPTNITAGRNLHAGDSGVVVITERTSESFGVGIGDEVTLFGQPFEVVGISGSSFGIMNSGAVYMSLSDAQSISDNTGKISSLKVFADANVDVTSVVDAIKALHPELSVVSAQDFEATPVTSASPQPATQNSSLLTQDAASSSSSNLVYVAIAAVALVVIVALVVLLAKCRGATRHAESARSSAPDSGDTTRSPFSYVSWFELNANFLVNFLSGYLLEASKI